MIVQYMGISDRMYFKDFYRCIDKLLSQSRKVLYFFHEVENNKVGV